MSALVAVSFSLLICAAPSDSLPKPTPSPAAANSNSQPNATPTDPDTTPTPSEEDPIAGLPEGDAPPLPAIVNWRLGNSVLAQNQLRKRISLGGWWRFAASPEREGRVVRPEMGWLEMPHSGRLTDAKILDDKLQPVLNVWRGQSLDKLPWWCIERDLSIPAEWVSTRVYLTITGGWKDAEVYSFDAPIDGVDQGDARWFDLTEDLAYGGTVRLQLRWKREGADAGARGQGLGAIENAADKTPASGLQPVASTLKPFIGLELTPIGPRVQAVTLRKDPQAGELEATIDLARPPFFLRPGARPIHEVPLALHLELRSADGKSVISKSTHQIGNMPEPTKTTAVRFPWSAKPGDAPPVRGQLHALLTFAEGGKFDIPFPIDFDLEAMGVVSDSPQPKLP